jgi:hypothetical protein
VLRCVAVQFESAGGMQALAAVRTNADTTAIMDGTAKSRMGATQGDNQATVRARARARVCVCVCVCVCVWRRGVGACRVLPLTRAANVPARAVVPLFQDQAADFSEPGSEAVRAAGGKGRFYVEAKPSQGLLLIKGARGAAKELLERLDVNGFLRKAQKSVHFKERIIEKMSHVLGLLLVEEEDRAAAMEEHVGRKEQCDHLVRKVTAIQVRCVYVCVCECRVVRARRRCSSHCAGERENLVGRRPIVIVGVLIVWCSNASGRRRRPSGVRCCGTSTL